jgi:hypothetical protein
MVKAFAKRFLREGRAGSANLRSGASSVIFGICRLTFFLAKTRLPFVIAKSYTIYFALTIRARTRNFASRAYVSQISPTKGPGLSLEIFTHKLYICASP